MLTTKSASEIEKDSVLVLTEAKVFVDDGIYDVYKLNKKLHGVQETVTCMSFNEATRYLTVDFDSGVSMKFYNPRTLIYKPLLSVEREHYGKG